MIDKIQEAFPETDFVGLANLNDAIIGKCGHSNQLVYSLSKIINILVGQGATYKQAFDHYKENIKDNYIESNRPIICYDYFD